MFTQTAWNHLGRVIDKFRAARGGNVVITFALALIPLMIVVGAAVDYSHANSIKVAMQAAADSTALAMSKTAGKLTRRQLQSQATAYFKAVFNRPETQNLKITATYNAGGSSLIITASGTMPTAFVGLIGFDSLAIGASGTATWGMTKLRIALVLDNTGSMGQAGKLTALKTASHSLLGMLQKAAQTDGDIEVAIVPFANGVNVDPANVNETWLDWSYYSASGGAGWSGGGGWGGRSGSYSSYGQNSGSGNAGYNGSNGSTGWSNGPGAWSPNNVWNGAGGTSCSWSSCWTSAGTWSGSTSGTNKSHWQGCVIDRDQDYDVKNTAPTTSITSTLFPAVYSNACPAPVMGLTYDWTNLNGLINSMVATGTTN
jgi:Flp pilus assembly protein TadG